MKFKAGDPEEEYFKAREIDLLRRKAIDAARETAERDKKRLKELHWMRCPKCGMQLTEIDFKKVKVDHCFSCGGMYLDGGELDRILQYKEPGFFGKVLSHLVGGD